MLGSFRIRLLAVIVIVFLAGVCMESNSRSQEIVERVIRYVLKDDGLNDKISILFDNMKPSAVRSLPVGSTSILQIPCEFSTIEQNYGWYYNETLKKQEFFPGVYLKVENNTAVKPIMEGRVEEIGRNEEGRSVVVQHNDGFYSLYGGLQEVLAIEDDWVDCNSVLGKCNRVLYLEIRSIEGPINPHNLIDPQT